TLARADGPLRAAMTALIAGPLSQLEERASSLVALGRGRAAGRADAARLQSEERRLEHELIGEAVPEARALLAASLWDVQGAMARHERRAHGARLAQPELRRLRALLEALPSWVEGGLEGAGGVRPGNPAGRDAIRGELAAAIDRTADVLRAME